MSGFRTHLATGLGVFAVTACALHALNINPTPLTLAEWCFFTLTGSLFPDIDTKSMGQKLLYGLLLMLFVFLLAGDQLELLAILGIIALLPMLMDHRGMLHRISFIVLFPLILALVCSFYTGVSCRILLLDALFFMLGALSHCILDRGFRRAFWSRNI